MPVCNLGIQRNFSLLLISKQISAQHHELKVKNDKRAFALLKAIAATQITASQNLSDYPALAAALEARKLQKAK